ncbi:MAG: hypothetical protein OXE49_05535 [Gemmatimonadetes bacterium]|nr:hypothetical protein [Gemmatimonadota bacterium]
MAVKTFAWLLLICWATDSGAQRQSWQIGGAGLAWSEGDSSVVLIDFDSVPGAIQPIYIDPDQSLFSLFTGWEPLKEPRELTFVEGETPRAWKGSQGNETTAHNGTYMVDGDSMSFNPPVSSNPESVWYTIDLAVPVPAHRFGFFTPPRGFRSDGIPFAEDAVPAYEVSIAAEGDPSWLAGSQPYKRIGPLIADVAENFVARVQIEFPRQYVRFVRYKRKTSLLDSGRGGNTSVGSGTAFKGSIGDFELFGEGVPRKVVYRSRIFDLGAPRNFGRLFWATTPLRRVDGELVEAPEAEVGVEVEMRTGRDEDPNIYHEYTDRGGEEVVTRERYDLVLQPRWRAGRLRDPRPGMRASITYDSDNWSFWSLPFSEPGQALDLKGGTHFQLRITLKSEDFAAFVRLDSLWIEIAPLLASRVVGEGALAGDVQPAGGLTQVPLGAAVELIYDIRGEFADEGAGFDALRIRTGTRAAFTRLEMGNPPRAIEPVEVVEGDEELAVVLPERVGPGAAEGVRVVFVADVFSLAWTFSGEVYNDGVDALPQPVEPGDASAELGTNSLRVLGMAGQSDGPVVGLDFSTRVLTPNGDGVHDEVEIGYALVGLPEDVPVMFKVYALDGRRVVQRSLGAQRFGVQRVRWDGRDEDGVLLSPGLYLVEVAPEAERQGVRRLRPLTLIY